MQQNSQSVWITGAGGLIGNCLIKTAPSLPLIPLLRSELDLTDFAAVESKFKKDQPGLVIHCAALSKSPECQTNPAFAKKINVEVTAHLAGLAKDIDFIFLSSELVFDGRKGNYLETDVPNPLSVYGETKVAAEQIVLKYPRHTVVRSTLCGGRSPNGHHAFNEQICDMWRAGKTAKLFSDEYRCVIPAPVTAHAIWELVAARQPGLYHLGGNERLSRVQIGQLIAARHPELEARIQVCSLREYEGAPRAADTSLNCAKIQKLLSFPLPGLSRWLQENPKEGF